MAASKNLTDSIGFEEHLDAYHLALGRFVGMFSSIEFLLQAALWRSAGTPAHIAKALFSGVRADAAVAHIRRIYEASEKPLPAPLERAFRHLIEINKIRNSVIHYGYKQLSTVEFFTSNSMLALPGREKSYPISGEILDQMTLDLRTIAQILAVYLSSFNPAAPSEAFQTVEVASRAPWRYKPASPSQARKKAGGRPNQGKRGNPRSPSQE